MGALRRICCRRQVVGLRVVLHAICPIFTLRADIFCYDAPITVDEEVTVEAPSQRAGDAGIPVESGPSNGPPRARANRRARLQRMARQAASR